MPAGPPGALRQSDCSPASELSVQQRSIAQRSVPRSLRCPANQRVQLQRALARRLRLVPAQTWRRARAGEATTLACCVTTIVAARGPLAVQRPCEDGTSLAVVVLLPLPPREQER